MLERTKPLLAGVVRLQISSESGQTAHPSWHRYGVLLPTSVVLAISVFMMAGLIVEPQIFRWVLSRFGETKPNGVFGFAFLTISLLLLDSSPWQLRAVARASAICAALIGALTCFEYLTGSSLGIDRLLFANPLSAVDSGRMSPVTALSLVLLGGAILLLDCHWGRFSPSMLLTGFTAGLSFLTLTGFAYDPGGLHQLRMFSSVSGFAPLSFLLLCTAITFARPERGVAAILLRPDLGGEAARRLLPAAIFVPFTVGLLIFKMHNAGTYGSALMVFLFVVAPVVIFVPLVLVSASLLSRMENERKQSENELRASTQRFSSVVASAMDAIITLDDSLRIVVFNEAAEMMFGCPAWEVMGAPLDRFLPPQFSEIHAEHVRMFGVAGITTRSMKSPGILSAVRSNGETFPIEATVSHIQVAGQDLYTVILRDITERKRVEETLRQSEDRFRSIYEQAAVGIGQVAADGQFLMVNAALCRMLGYEESELRGKKVHEIIHPDDLARETVLLDAMQRGDQPQYAIEKRYLHRDGSAVWVNVNTSAVRDSAGALLYRISVIQNVTERKRAEEQLKQAQKMEAIGRLAGGVAHDFNTLLNVMLGYSDILLAELPPEDALRERVIQIRNSGNAAAMLTKQLLAFSRKQAIVQEVVDLREVSSKLTPILGRLLRDDIELTVKYSEEICPVKVDPGQIQQLMLNLVANAGDAMPEGGQLNIEVRVVELDENYVQQHPTLKVGRHAMLAICDSGTGMDAQTVAHIFEPFFTTKEAGRGTGLGLATVYGIAKSNGGDIWVYSELGVGTIFKVFLPLTTEPLRHAELAPVESPTTSDGGGETILLVEDSAALRELTKVILLRNGYKVLEAEDGITALEVSRQFPGVIHMVLTDVVMPRMRGPHLAEQIVKQRPGIAVVFLSGYTEEAIAQSDRIKGFTLVEKPYTSEVLLHSIRHALDNSLPPHSVRNLNS
jgi:PAS domain S-box-containing protein